MRKVILVLATAALMAIAGGAPAEITGADRDAFIGPFVESCASEAAKDPNGARADPKLVQAICTCQANYFADNSTVAQIVEAQQDAAKGEVPAWMTEMARKSASFCKANLDSYYHGS